MVKKTRKALTSKSSSLVTRRVPEFFKIFLSPESFYKMKVPVEFLEQLTCGIPGSFSLCGPSGKVWRVRLLEMGDGYYFKDGWEDFVIDNFMSNKDFCAFKYVSKNCLQVQIFERNGCEKESAFKANCSQASTTNFSARHKGKKAVKNQGERLGGPFISRRRDITVEAEHMALNAALGFVSKKPYAMITMRKSHVYTGFCLPLPRSFWKAHLPDCSQEMTLRDPRGETWSVRLYVNQIHQVGQLTEGWRKISFTNNIEASDVCIFELVKPNEFKLHIFRVIEEIIPLRRQRDM
ncbi:B3 domain-containing protein Os11g0197600-like isoform X2 [Papaver somniferum]|uniref:B3 domain-containing protein Os11g0197600-like isoform X2 n=1 Tax=Papaver somniferum TaxID=3469 RepID=UPI000E6FBDB3|nr:B3 domain-containing protein Os11g0197600-like isoform X2 [Papaver somniferum]